MYNSKTTNVSCREHTLLYAAYRSGMEEVMNIVCLDMEGVLVPEIWIAFSSQSGIPELRRTTRDEPDYEKLMREQVLPHIRAEGLTAAVYTQITDVEEELNGLMTYDREVLKIPEETLQEINAALHFDA